MLIHCFVKLSIKALKFSSVRVTVHFLFEISVLFVGVAEIVPVVKSIFLIPFIVEIILAFNSAFVLLIEVFN